MACNFGKKPTAAAAGVIAIRMSENRQFTIADNAVTKGEKCGGKLLSIQYNEP